jgi:hypothetical protein
MRATKIAIDVARRIGHLAHVQVALADGEVIVDYELELCSIAGRSSHVARPSLIMRQGNVSSRQDRHCTRQRVEPLANGRAQQSHVILDHNTSEAGCPPFA